MNTRVLVTQNKKTAILTFPTEQLLVTNPEVMFGLLTGKRKSFPEIKIMDAPKGGYSDAELNEDELAWRKKIKENPKARRMFSSPITNR
jgi:hypothetical protein